MHINTIIIHDQPQSKDLPWVEIGQLYLNKDPDFLNEVYIVVKIENKYTLVCLNDGTHWLDLKTDINSIFGHDSTFARLEVPITIEVPKNKK